eukprot:TRINITY_DN4172_c0_g1_i2.p1 TRINITY_DN4172_c0_g1~~TRINITY_DN4172_c0_g1_i2.p1  ORF type:complete len:664 (+),score=94.18 TRINITY_DN4172_c0_g1_i2:48-2039(+)
MFAEGIANLRDWIREKGGVVSVQACRGRAAGLKIGASNLFLNQDFIVKDGQVSLRSAATAGIQQLPESDATAEIHELRKREATAGIQQLQDWIQKKGGVVSVQACRGRAAGLNICASNLVLKRYFAVRNGQVSLRSTSKAIRSQAELGKWKSKAPRASEATPTEAAGSDACLKNAKRPRPPATPLGAVAGEGQNQAVEQLLRSRGGHAKIKDVLSKIQGMTKKGLADDFFVHGEYVALRPFHETIASFLRTKGAAKASSFLKRKRWAGVVDKHFLRKHFAIKKGVLMLGQDAEEPAPREGTMAEDLAECLRKGALLHTKGDQKESEEILAAGGLQAYAGHLEPGEHQGDQVFRHPFVQSLVQAARLRVEQELSKQPKADRWLICIRTYGRAGNPSHGSWDRRIGCRARGIYQMTLAALERSLGPNAHERCLIFASHEDPDFTSGRLASSLRGTPWEYRVVQGVKGADFQVRFMEEAFPRGSHLVVLDDNIDRFVVEHQPSLKQGGNRELTSGSKTDSELAMLIRMAGSEMDAQGANIWTVSPTFNHFVLFAYGEQIRRNRAKHGPSFPEYTTKLGLVYGACFGFRVLHDASRYTRYGQVKDDVERSLRYWHQEQCRQAHIQESGQGTGRDPRSQRCWKQEEQQKDPDENDRESKDINIDGGAK